EHVTKQLNKLVNFINSNELKTDSAVRRERLEVKVRTDATMLSQVVETEKMFHGKVVDAWPDAVTDEATGNGDKISSMLRMLDPYGVRELVQSGMVAVGRGPRSITANSLR